MGEEETEPEDREQEEGLRLPSERPSSSVRHNSTPPFFEVAEEVMIEEEKEEEEDEEAGAEELFEQEEEAVGLITLTGMSRPGSTLTPPSLLLAGLDDMADMQDNISMITYFVLPDKASGLSIHTFFPV